MGGKKFNARRAPVGQVQARVGDISKTVIARMAASDIGRVNMGMVNAAAAKNGIPPALLTQHLRQLGARI